ncbi:transposase for ISMyma06 [Mycobacteroides abscessus subsp. abscessus]|nr:transposase for ISMyma06 [Mycobacteroides abscessus subsp. abscessus]
MTHTNAPLTPEGRRRLAVLVAEEGWSLRRVAERFQCSPATAKRWVDRYRAGQPLTDCQGTWGSPCRRTWGLLVCGQFISLSAVC